ncbi:DUF4383 domain-containing protein [Mycobacterium sp. IS-1590]|uniref:DUF4383 domain-containing protein n=1 Tax=Mycobacterium sp. IS-1590 TaxID=1772286 RepID=UPI000A739B4D|nr:DUF4383 domain-containing protein [Mycobacterium sp. IS-1590]
MVSSHPPGRTAVTRYGAPVQKAALAVGATFLLVGILGFIPGITTNYDSMTFAGHHSGAMLLGIFNVSILHNIVHLLFGVAGVLMARTFDAARIYLIGGGIIYLLLFVYGLVIDHDSAANFVPLNTADNWLHLVLGAAMIALGVLLSRRVIDANTPFNRNAR